MSQLPFVFDRQCELVKIGDLSRAMNPFYVNDLLIPQRDIVWPEFVIGLTRKYAKPGDQIPNCEARTRTVCRIRHVVRMR